MNTLFHSPGTCSLGIHILLEEIGAPYELTLIDVTKGKQHQPDYLAINPKAKVPALKRADASLLTEWPAIAVWLALSNPDKNLLPSDPEGLARTLEAVDYIIASVHMHGFTRLWLPIHFSPNEADHPAIREKGRQIFEKGLAHFNTQLEGRDYLGGASPSIADAALFYVTFWKVNRMKQDPPPNVAAHYARMCQRPAVARALQMEGLA
jgi:glutathione S-transferase